MTKLVSFLLLQEANDGLGVKPPIVQVFTRCCYGVSMTERPQCLFLWKVGFEILEKHQSGIERHQYRAACLFGFKSAAVGVWAVFSAETGGNVFC